jgi:hypothetical protein
MPGSELHGEALALYDLLLRPSSRPINPTPGADASSDSDPSYFDAVNVPETVLFDPQGRICRWIFTASDGTVRARAQRTKPTLHDVERRFAAHAQWESAYGCNVTAVEERARPRLLDKHALHDALEKIHDQCELYAEHTARGAGSDESDEEPRSMADARRRAATAASLKRKDRMKPGERGPLRATQVPVCVQRFFAPKDGVRYTAVLQGLPFTAAEDEAAGIASKEGGKSSPFAAAASARRRRRVHGASATPRYMRAAGKLRSSQRRAMRQVSDLDALLEPRTWTRPAPSTQSVRSATPESGSTSRAARCRWRIGAKRQKYLVTRAAQGRVGGTSSLVSHFAGGSKRPHPGAGGGRPGSAARGRRSLAPMSSLEEPRVAEWLEREIARTSTEVWRWIRDAHGILLDSLEIKFVCDRFSTLHLVGMHSAHVCELLRAATSPRKSTAAAALGAQQPQLAALAVDTEASRGAAVDSRMAPTSVTPPANALDAAIGIVLPVDMSIGSKRPGTHAKSQKQNLEKVRAVIPGVGVR